MDETDQHHSGSGGGSYYAGGRLTQFGRKTSEKGNSTRHDGNNYMLHSMNQRSMGGGAGTDLQSQTNRTYTSHSAVTYQAPTTVVNQTSITAGGQTLVSDATPARENFANVHTSATHTGVKQGGQAHELAGGVALSQVVGAAVISRGVPS